MMTKKHSLLTVLCVCALSILFAFKYPEAVREKVLTLFFPDEKPSYGQDFSEKEKSTAKAKDLNLLKGEWTLAGPDTFPPIKERNEDFINANTKNPVDLRDPKAVEQKVEFDPVTNMYIVTEKIGNDYYRAPTYMTFDEYMRWRERKQQREYFDRLQGKAMPGEKTNTGIVDPVARLGVKKPSLVERLFGGTEVDIKPQGNINLTFGYNYQKIENPILTLRQQRTGIFDFDMDINMSAQGKIGEKLNLNFNYNTQATFDLDNQMKLQYDPKGFSEDEILQGLEAGQVSLPLKSNLIKGAQNLFGVKADLKFGHLKTTLLASQQRSRQNQLTVQGGSQLTTYERPVDEYDENRHFLLTHWNRAQFEPSLRCLPVPLTNFTITRMEVWITNDRQLAGGVQPNGSPGVRDVVALTDLGEPEILGEPAYKYPTPPSVDPKTGRSLRDNNNVPLPENINNALYPQILDALKGPDSIIRRSDRVINVLRNKFNLRQIKDFEKVQAVQLSPSEYNFNDQLGFISINRSVQPDQTIGVAFEYTYNGIPYKIGEFSSDVAIGDTVNQNVLFVKMLKSTTPNVKLPIWDLMMKNVYSVGAVNVDPNEFRFDIFYEDPGKGQKRFFDAAVFPPALKARPLLQVFNMDNLNLQGDPGADGIFDFIPGLTVNLRSGRIMFPVLEPFGSFLYNKMRDAGMDSVNASKYIYTQLYDSTLFRAREFQQFNRFMLRGSYKGQNNSEISLGTFNLPRGSVRVSGPGGPLVEGRDYTVDYNIGKVRILNESILQSGQSVNVSFEDNTLFGFQQRSMIGARFDYDGFGKDINLGGTFMNVFERPLTQKVNYGDDPINNKMYGLDFSISKEAPWLTKMVDKLPFLSTKEASSISSQLEVALLQPGFNRAINFGEDRGGTVYLDDFEGSTANFRIDFPANQWAIASVPQGDLSLFPESERSDSLLGVNRARLAWYNGGETAFRSSEDANRPYTRSFQQNDLFPNRQIAPNEQPILRGLDITLFPRERGPYNYEIPSGYPGISAGLTNLTGELNDPQTRWAGIMRGLNTNDFEASNIEFIEFWMLNPYMDQGDNSPVSDGGDFIIDLGTISEDIMRDSRQFFENGLPTSANSATTVRTPWGRVPVLPPVVNAFDNDNAKRALQDVGLDGLDNVGERAFLSNWLNVINSSSLAGSVRAAITADPSNDDFVYFGDQNRFTSESPLFDRYKFFNNPEGNSPSNENAPGNPLGNPSATNLPDVEDLNRDNSLNENESFFRYKLPLKRGVTTLPDGSTVDGLDMEAPILKDIITETQVANVGGQRHVWYRFKLPLDLPERKALGGIQDFRSIRFIRMLWKGFSERTTFRFATIELGRNQWRRYTLNLAEKCDFNLPSKAAFDVNAVSIEENSARLPFNYTIPPGITREQSVGAFPSIQQNEQALSMNVCSLEQCQAKAIFKPLNMDLRQFKRVKMFAHLEGIDNDRAKLDDDDLKIFVRFGSDFVNNYYEYEIPLVESDAKRLNSNPESRDYKLEVWRPENNLDFPLEVFTRLKQLRNGDPNTNLGQIFDQSFNTVFGYDEKANPNARVKIIGNPNLGYVRGVMIGVRNTDSLLQTKCFEVWVNEFRLNGFNEQGGYAGQGRVDMKLADFGNISLSGNYTSIGWGSIEQRLVQRQREEIIQYDASTTLELGKFFGQKAGIRLPLYLSYANITRNPEYDPYDLDIKLKDKLRGADPADRDSIRALAQDVTVTRGFNFTNVRKERTGGARKLPLPWNIENFSLTYAFNQTRRRTPFIINDEQNQYKGGLDWQYATGIKPIYPFKKLIKKDKYLKFLSEFNFNPIPNTYGFNTILDRVAQKTTYRFAGEDPGRNTYYNRRFTWDRNYDVGWDITKALRFNLDINARSLIDEPIESEANNFVVTKEERRDSILTNMRNLGRPKLYTQSASLNYTLPFKYIPFMDFISMRASYTANYTWTAQSLKLANMDAGVWQESRNERHLGNVIQNTSVRQISGDLNFETLYNKSKYLARINKPGKSSGSSKGKKDSPGKGGKDTPGGPGGDPRSGGPGGDPRGGGRGGDLTGGDLPRDKAENSDKKSDRKDDPKNSRDRDPASATPAEPGAKTAGGVTTPGAGDGKTADGKKDKKKDKGKDKKDDKDDDKKAKKDRQPTMAERIALRPLMLLRKGRFSYTENYGTVLPGFTPDPRLMGLSNGFEAPGWSFAAGLQPDDKWLEAAGQKGWISHRNELNQQVTRSYSQNIDAGVTIEPFTDFRVELNLLKQYTRNNTLLFKDFNTIIHPDSVDIEQRARRDMGSYTISYFALNTLFDKDVDGMFERFKNNRSVISQRLGREVSGNTDPHIKYGNEYAYGYGRTQQEVLLPAFLSAYTNKDPNSFGLDVFKTLPSLNWKLNYNGLSKIGKLNKIFSSITLQHGYTSKLTMASYNTDIFFQPQSPFVLDELNADYIARFEIPQVVISENLQPLIGVNVKMKNGFQASFDFKKSRQLAMSFVDYQLAETRSTGYTGEIGYTAKNVNIPFLTGKKAVKSKGKKSKSKKKDAKKPGTKPAPPAAGGGKTPNDMIFKFNMDFRDDLTANHRLDQANEAQPTRGQRQIRISPSIDYNLNRRLSLRVFADYSKTVPKTSQSFPITTLNTGVTVQFTLN